MKLSQDIIDKAIEQSQKAHGHHYKHGAVVFDRQRIISVGNNKKKIVPKLKEFGYPRLMLHSESMALLKARPEELVGSSVLVVRKCATKLANSKPCSSCMAMMNECGIKKVYYSDTDGSIKVMNI